jgi:hypothetical protein
MNWQKTSNMFARFGVLLVVWSLIAFVGGHLIRIYIYDESGAFWTLGGLHAIAPFVVLWALIEAGWCYHHLGPLSLKQFLGLIIFAVVLYWPLVMGLFALYKYLR